MLLIEQNDEWLVGRRYLSEASMTLVLARDPDDPRPTIGTGTLHAKEAPQPAAF